MKPDDLDRILLTDDDLVPASGLASSVMDMVRGEASAPPPIPFPWGRLASGLVAVLALAVWLASSRVAEPLWRALLSQEAWSTILAGAVDGATNTGATWIAGALLAASRHGGWR